MTRTSLITALTMTKKTKSSSWFDSLENHYFKFGRKKPKNLVDDYQNDGIIHYVRFGRDKPKD